MTVSNVPLAVQRARLLKEVPPFRPVAVQLLNLVSDISQPLARVVSLLRTDAVLTAEVLRLANSPLLGCRSEIKNILQALAFLGMERVNSLIVTTAMRGLAGPASGNLARSCWRHNLATAVICERLAPALRISQERGYMAGLIHDIGRLALLRAFPNYEKALTQAVCRGEKSAGHRKRSLRDGPHRSRPMAPGAVGLPFGSSDCRLHARKSGRGGRTGPGTDLPGGDRFATGRYNGFLRVSGHAQKELARLVEMLPEATSQLADFRRSPNSWPPA